jgi:mannose-6-phosphate isomerase-like protein (cupin superfamily)
VVYILDGEAEITIGGQPQTGATGEMLMIPANIAYALQAYAIVRSAAIKYTQTIFGQLNDYE